jgi:hypothetical protein
MATDYFGAIQQPDLRPSDRLARRLQSCLAAVPVFSIRSHRLCLPRLLGGARIDVASSSHRRGASHRPPSPCGPPSSPLQRRSSVRPPQRSSRRQSSATEREALGAGPLSLQRSSRRRSSTPAEKLQVPVVRPPPPLCGTPSPLQRSSGRPLPQRSLLLCLSDLEFVNNLMTFVNNLIYISWYQNP